MLDLISRLESEVRGYVRAFPTVFTSAKGSVLTDSDGKTYIDFFAGAGALNYGHNNPKAKQALIDYLQADGVQHSLDMATEAKVSFVKRFEEFILKPRGLNYKLQFTGPTGTNAVEAAIKLARKQKRRSHIVAFTNAYHGHTLGSLALTGNQYYHDEHFGSHSNVTHLPFDGYIEGFNSAELFRKQVSDPSSGLPKPAAVIFETIQGEGGINVASIEWMQEIADICSEHDILLIVDDIQVGNGRTGTFFSFEDADFTPDIVCLSKSIGGGMPMSLLLIKPECDAWQPGEHTGTFRGNNFAFIAGGAMLEYWADDELEKQISESSDMIVDCLESIAIQHACKLRGRGMIWGLDFGDGALVSRITEECFKNGLIVESAGAEGNVLKLLPPINIPVPQLREGLAILRSAITKIVNGKTDSVICPSTDVSGVFEMNSIVAKQ